VAMRSRPGSIAQPHRRWVEDPDGALVGRARGGDRAAFEELVRRHADQVYGIARRLGLSAGVAQEVTQEAFLRAWRGIGAFEGESRFFTWLYRIAFNEARRRLEREPPRGLVSSLDEEGAIDPADLREEPYARVARAELGVALARAVRALPVEYRAPLILRDIEGLSTADAAAVLGIGEAAFKSRLHRARVAVREGVENWLVDGT